MNDLAQSTAGQSYTGRNESIFVCLLRCATTAVEYLGLLTVMARGLRHDAKSEKGGGEGAAVLAYLRHIHCLGAPPPPQPVLQPRAVAQLPADGGAAPAQFPPTSRFSYANSIFSPGHPIYPQLPSPMNHELLQSLQDISSFEKVSDNRVLSAMTLKTVYTVNGRTMVAHTRDAISENRNVFTSKRLDICTTPSNRHKQSKYE